MSASESPHVDQAMVERIILTLRSVADVYSIALPLERTPAKMGFDLARMMGDDLSEQDLADALRAFCDGVETGVTLPSSPGAEAAMHLASATRAVRGTLASMDAMDRAQDPEQGSARAWVRGYQPRVQRVFEEISRIGAEYSLLIRAEENVVVIPAVPELELELAPDGAIPDDQAPTAR